jgi:hypothetical protein
MIFTKILKGIDLDFDISLEKTEYKPGETVRGLVTLKTEKGFRARQLMLFAEGKESTIITVEDSTRGYGTSGSRWDRSTYSEFSTFFSEDLSQLLQRSISSNILQDGTLEIPPENKEIAVEFTLPSSSTIYLSVYLLLPFSVCRYMYMLLLFVYVLPDMPKAFDCKTSCSCFVSY